MKQLPSKDSSAIIRAAARSIQNGGLVVIPSETVYGLGANALNQVAISKIFEAKCRPPSNPLIVHVSSLRQVEELTREFPQLAQKLAKKFWPGPLTLVLPKNNIIPDAVTAGLENVAIRIPAHPTFLSLLKACKVPVAAPSANVFGYLSPTQLNHVSQRILDFADYALDGGHCNVGIESTVISFCQEYPLLLRPGGLPLESIVDLIGSVEIAQKANSSSGSPGLTASHYSPITPLFIIDETQLISFSGNFGIIRFSTTAPITGAKVVVTLTDSFHPESAAAKLFAELYKLDQAGLDFILAYPIPESGLGRGIMDRLRRAAIKFNNLKSKFQQFK